MQNGAWFEWTSFELMKLKSFLPAILAFSGLLGAANAATVTFSTNVISPTDTTGSFLNNQGTVLTAVSFGTTRTGPYTYNAPNATSNPNSTPTINGIAFSSSAGAINPTNTYYALGGGLTGNQYDTGRFSNVSYTNESLFGLLYDVARSSGNSTRQTLNLTSLAVGGQYRLQMIFSSINTADTPSVTADRNVTIAAGVFTEGANAQLGTGADGTSATYAYGPTTGARVITADFTATANSELFTMLSGSTGGNSRVSLAGFVLTAVPEPSSVTLAAAGVLALVLPRRRK